MDHINPDLEKLAALWAKAQLEREMVNVLRSMLRAARVPKTQAQAILNIARTKCPATVAVKHLKRHARRRSRKEG